MLGTVIGVPSFTTPASTVTPTTMGPRELKMCWGRIRSLHGNTAICLNSSRFFCFSSWWREFICNCKHSVLGVLTVRQMFCSWEQAHLQCRWGHLWNKNSDHKNNITITCSVVTDRLFSKLCWLAECRHGEALASPDSSPVVSCCLLWRPESWETGRTLGTKVMIGSPRTHPLLARRPLGASQLSSQLTSLKKVPGTDSVSHVARVRCWFLSVLRPFFSGFSSKNQRFKIPSSCLWAPFLIAEAQRFDAYLSISCEFVKQVVDDVGGEDFHA